MHIYGKLYLKTVFVYFCAGKGKDKKRKAMATRYEIQLRLYLISVPYEITALAIKVVSLYEEIRKAIKAKRSAIIVFKNKI